MSTIHRISRIASQLLGDLDAVESITTDRSAASQQKLQLIIDAFERVGEIALADASHPNRLPTEVDHMRDNLI